ncbi:MAG: transmembrane 9 family protein [Ruminococcaceae bacterium]|nr:transmembrane 9 family protein [Oscillospiraceae bacterium]
MGRKQSNALNIQRNQFNKNKNESLLLSIIIGIIACFATMLIISYVLSMLSLKFRNPINMTDILSVACVIFGGISSGFGSALKYKKNPLLASTLCTSLISVIIIIFNLTSDMTSILNLLFFPMLLIICGISCGFIYRSATNTKRIKKYLK